MANTTTFTMRINTDIHTKLKYVVWANKSSAAKVALTAFEKEIAAYEKKHGEITEKQLKDARII